MTDLLGVFWFSLTIYTRKRSFCTLSYEKNAFRRYISLYHVGIDWFLSKMPFSLIKAIYLQLFVFIRKDLTLINIFDKIFFQKKIYIKIYIKKNENRIFYKFQHKITGKL